VSIDVDVLDPAYAPGVSNPEPYGLTIHSLLYNLENVVGRVKDIAGFDIVEVNPLVDVNDVTSLVSAKLIIEYTGLISKYKNRS